MINIDIDLIIILLIFVLIFTQIERDNKYDDIHQNKKEGFCANCGGHRRWNRFRNYDYYYDSYYYPTYGYAYYPLPCMRTLFGDTRCYY